MIVWLRRITLAVVLAASAGVVLVAQEAAQNEFVPVKPGDLQQERIPATPLVFGAYAFVWVVFVVYLFLLWQRMKRVEADLKVVSSKLGSPRG